MPRKNAKAGALFRTLALAALVVGLAAAGPEKSSTINNVSLQEVDGTTQLAFSADGPVACQTVTAPDPTLVVVDVMGANHELPRVVDMHSGAVNEIRTDIWHTEDGVPVTRVTVVMKKPSRSWVEKADNGFTVMVDPSQAPEQAAVSDSGAAPADPAAAAVAAPATVDAMAEAAVDKLTENQGSSDTWGDVTMESPAPPAPATTPDMSDMPPPDLTPAPVTDASASQKPAAPAPEASASSTSTGGLTPAEEMMKQPTEFKPVALDESKRFANGGPRVSLDVQGADIRTVMRSLAEYSGTNIVISKDIKGFLTVNLTEVPWVDALTTICQTQGLGWVEEQGIIRVETLENLRKEEVARSTADRQLEDLQPLSTQIVRVVYATASEMKPAIEKTLTGRGHVEIDPRTNSMVITDVSRRVSAAVEMVRHLDSRTPQIEITAKLVDVDARYTRDLGINWGLGQIHSTDQAASGEATINANDVLDPAASVRFGLVRSWGTINAMLTALETDNKADIISNPRITTVNNREARILVGRKIPLIVLDEAGNAVTQLTTIGITLQVTPHINDDDRITLDLHPEVSDLASQATVQGGIIINTSEADTRVIVDDGETAVIGGLIRSNTSKLKRGVPILRSIPILGYIFSGTSEVKEKRELLIFITPRIVTNWAQTG